MLINERRWIEPTARVVAITQADKRRQKLAHLATPVRAARESETQDRHAWVVNFRRKFDRQRRRKRRYERGCA